LIVRKKSEMIVTTSIAELQNIFWNEGSKCSL